MSHEDRDRKADVYIYESSTRLLKVLGKFSSGFLRFKKFFRFYVFEIRFICVQNVMYVILATL